ncbi:MAG TPA: alpha/beta hydrolase [Steroidobacteraceae bacterium]|nr:alpha/beta hydrolase [Steroidobacteraceae bacterium]
MTSLFNPTLRPKYEIPENARAILVLIHGMAEYSGRYQSIVEYFVAHGIGCISFDLRGHGSAPKTEAERGDVESFGDFVTDSCAVIEGARARYPRLPLFVWGHSMGAIVATLAASQLASQGPGKIRGVITSGAPIAAFDGYSKFTRRLLALLSYVVPKHRVPRPFKPERLSRDLDVGLRYGADPLVPKAITLRLLVGMSEACERCLRVAPKLLMPWLALHGSDDRIAPPIGSQRLIDALGSRDKQLRVFPEARHEVHNEIEPTRTEFLNCIVEWVNARA